MRIDRFAAGAMLALTLGGSIAVPTAATAQTRPMGVFRTPPMPGRVFIPGWKEWVYTSVPTCRAFDTRGGAPLAANASRGFYIGGTATFVTQGGPSGGCGVPTFAKGVVLSLTSLNASANGSLSVGPVGTAPVGYAVSFQQGVPATASVTSRLGPQANLLVKAVGAATNVVGDVTGYYSSQVGGIIDFNGDIYSNSGAFVSAEKWSPTSVGLYTVTVDRDITYCAILTSTSATTDVYSHGWLAGTRSFHISSWALNADARSTPWAGYIYVAVIC